MISRAYLPEGRFGADLAALGAEVTRVQSIFDAAGAARVEPGALLAAEVLLDLYGEDIRARAYITQDPVEGELVLRPDFTVPVVQMHMDHGGAPARYTYAGPVWRRQDVGVNRPNEYLQVGFELFDGADPAAADAEVFTLFALAVAGQGLSVATGDLGILYAAIDALSTNDRRKAALRRHVWRPKRFRELLARYGATPTPAGLRAEMIAAAEKGADAVETLIKAQGPVTGLRSVRAITTRANVLLAEQSEARISTEQLQLIEAIFGVSAPAPEALAMLKRLSADMNIEVALNRLEARLEALAAKGVDVETLPFEASYGRTTLEYYDGFVFGFYDATRPDLPAIASGGRYDALTRVLGQGASIPAVGGIYRPEAALACKGGLS